MNLLPSVSVPIAEAEGLSIAGLYVYLLIVLAILFGTMAVAKNEFSQRIFKGMWAQLYEQLYLFIENMCVGTIGPHGRKYITLIMSLWMVIFVGNVLALFSPESPTADLSFNLAMAVLVVAYVQWEGIKSHGAFGHLTHFAGPKLGSLPLLPITLLIFIIEIVSELMKNVSLSLRLFGNIHGGHEAVEAMNHLGAPAYVPLGGILLPIKLLTCVVQAMIFTLLSCVYISLVTGHADDHQEAEKMLESAYPENLHGAH